MRWIWLLVAGLLISGQAGARTHNDDFCRRVDQYDSYVLAMTWQPGFCEHVRGNSEKPECRALTTGTLNIDHLTLHGLWPNKRSCGIGYGQCPGPALHLQPETIASIQPWMPNWYFSSDFGTYEWRKHGTCQTALDDDRYFRKAVNAVKTFNGSLAGRYVAEHIGGALSKQILLEKFNQEVGDERAADNLLLLCEGPYLYEIRLLLAQEFIEDKGIATMMAGAIAEQAGNDRHECRNDRILIEQSGR